MLPNLAKLILVFSCWLTTSNAQGSKFVPSENLSVYQKKYFTGDYLTLWSNQTDQWMVEQCAVQCSHLNRINKTCNGFTFSMKQCHYFVVENERYEPMTSHSSDLNSSNVIYVNTREKNTMQNYRMLAVGMTQNDYLTSLVGENVNCAGTKIPKFATNHLPSKIQRFSLESIAYAFETATLLVCGGIYDTSPPTVTSNECYYVKLDDPSTDNWEGPVNMKMGRNGACSVAVKDKIYIIGGGLNANDPPNNFVEVFDTRAKLFTDQTSTLLPYVNAGLMNTACLIAMPDENAFAITGGGTASLSWFPSNEVNVKNTILYHTDTSAWEPLPDLPNIRHSHGCSRIDINKNQYLIVYGGAGTVEYGDILFLDLNQRSLGWFNVPGIQLGGLSSFISGGIVKHLSATSCDMMFNAYSTGLNVCKGNFNWTVTPLNPGPVSGWKKTVAVGANPFPTCV